MRSIVSPYGHLTGGVWMKGNLHAHTDRSDGTRTFQDIVSIYADLGYDFLAVTDHDLLTALSDYAELVASGLVLLPGNEITANGPHILHIGGACRVSPSPQRQDVFNSVAVSGGFAVVNHPNWESNFNHCPFEKLSEWSGYAGIEIYNSAINRLDGSPYATGKWDRILSTGRRIWGFANDDTHAEVDEGLGWNVAYAAERTPEAVVNALVAGRFYASTGVSIDAIDVTGERIAITANSAGRVSAFSDHGARFAYSNDSTLEIDFPANATYVRFECYGRGEQQAWTQPFFIG